MKRFASLCVGIALLAAAPAGADDHRPDRSGHPRAILGAVLHPVGWLIDTLIFRPAHWLEHHEPLKTIEGHDED
jgi:hypothetical protein